MINIKEKFIQLTNEVTPRGCENMVISLIPEIKFEKDEFNNYYLIIKKEDGTFSNTMFTSHLDTVDSTISNYGYWDSTKKTWIKSDKKSDKKIKHVFDNEFIKTDGNSNLGADDKSGVVIMLNLISEKVPGLYYFFIGEESGCIGSSDLSRNYEEKVKNGSLPKVNKCISFDRKGYDSIITNQKGIECCSVEFAKDLADKLNEYGFWYKLDSNGIYTDSAEFLDIIPECTNISVGYFSEHTKSEKQDIEFLELLSNVLTKIDWENLTINRNVSNVRYTGKKFSNNKFDKFGEWDDDDWCGYKFTGYEEEEEEEDSKLTPNKYFDSGNGEVVKLDDEFDKWYNEQKNKISEDSDLPI